MGIRFFVFVVLLGLTLSTLDAKSLKGHKKSKHDEDTKKNDEPAAEEASGSAAGASAAGSGEESGSTEEAPPTEGEGPPPLVVPTPAPEPRICPGTCPQVCAPACMENCCQTPMPPPCTPPGPCPAPLPVPMPAPCPSVCAPMNLPSCCQAPPPPPPPPPPPTQLIKKFMNIVGAKKRSSLKRNKAPKDPMAVAMSEMMQRIKTGNIQLKPVKSPSTTSSESDDTDAMSDLGNLLKTLKRNPSVDVGPGVSSPGADGSPVEWANIKLRKPSSSVESSKETSNSGDAGNGNNELKKVVLRKPRSHSAGDILDDRPKDEATAELKRILQRQKAAAEKENAEQNSKGVCENGAA